MFNLDDIFKKKDYNKQIEKLVQSQHVDYRFVKDGFVADDVLLDAIRNLYNIVVIPHASISDNYDKNKYNGTCLVTQGEKMYSISFIREYIGFNEEIIIDFNTLKYEYSM